MDAVIYVRVEIAQQAKLRAQRFLVLCQRYTERAGFTVIGEFQDIGAGTSIKRPGLEALRQRVRQGGVEIVIVYTLSQLGRSGWQPKMLQKEFAEQGARLCSVSRSTPR